MTVNVKFVYPPKLPNCLAQARVVLADGDRDSLVISEICILQSSQGLYVSMPSSTDFQLGFNRQLRRKIEETVMAAFEEWLWKQLQSKRQVPA